MKYQLLWLAGAGALGTLARHGISLFVQTLIGPRFPWLFPWGTLAVNGIGCFLFGVVWPLAEERMLIAGSTRFVILTGFMGALTTYSTYTFETGQMLSDGEWIKAAANVLAQHVCGFTFFFLGFFVGRQL